MEQDEIVTPVPGPGAFVVGGIHRLVFAVADGANAVRADASLGQRFAGGQRAAFAERAIVFLRAAFVAIAFDEQLVTGIGAQSRGHSGNAVLLTAPDDRAVE